MATFPSKDKLVKGMKAQNVTRGWDVMVSYTATKLNGVLKDLWKSGIGAQSFTVKASLDLFGLTAVYAVKLDAPTLEFVTEGAANAKLTMPISGTVRTYPEGMQDTAKPIKEIPINAGAWVLTVEVPLVSVTGKIDGAPPPPSEETQKKPTEVVFMDPAKKTEKNIIFHFNSTTKNWAISQVPNATGITQEVTALMASATLQVQNWFQTNVKSVDYIIAKISNEKSAEDPNSLLQPQSFIFASHGTGTNAVLSIYIKTVGSENNSGIVSPTFQYEPKVGRDKGKSSETIQLPVPENYSASIIIHHEIIRDLYLIPQINATLKSDDVPTPASNATGDQDTGILLDVKLSEKFVKSTNDPGFFFGFYCNDLEFKLKDHPVRLSIQDGKANWSMNHQMTVHWQENSLDNTIVGDVDITFNVNKETSLTVSQSEIAAIDLTFRKSDLSISTKAQPEPSSYKYKAPGSISYSEHLPDQFKTLTAEFKDVTIKVKSINFFATKNVFASGGVDIIDIDTAAGIMVPHDMLLVGNVVPPVTR